ncbi:acyloxyacyl hydrolase [Winogradskyella eckloniae]|uniref:acyloxyacyl hydrolase n=1 Tax=Winogradskyella eckloniae TaxID=1089306 RepID=UPI0015663BC8|nr:acyloxyacyl hydrolase [Winogradskyella eckloniae]NRD21080.1 acyloxyacyl hydrolase [Winogradskyella eckloniae]
MHTAINLKFFIGIFVVVFSQNCWTQSTSNSGNTSVFVSPELHIGKTLEANTQFPKTKLQKSLFLSLGRFNFNKNKEWAARLNYPKTGISFGYTDFGNSQSVGHAYSILPFIEFSIFQNKIKGLNLQTGFGSSYINVQYNANTNAFNRAISSKINWSFRSFLFYDVMATKRMDWRIGLGYLHHSNGHTSLPNQGLNSIATSISTTIKNKHLDTLNFEQPNHTTKSQNYLSARIGIGQNVLSKTNNNEKEVYSIAASAGKIINNTFKFGGGFYYRFYEHYYDYINTNGTLVSEQFPHYTKNPFGYATNFGLFATSELLIDHIGFELEIGLNIYKPFYKIDWQLNQGYSYLNGNGETVEVLGELDWYYEIKRTISSRMGLKYYLWTTNKAPTHNLYLAAHINANLGQADFTELSCGYIYRFQLKEKNKSK